MCVFCVCILCQNKMTTGKPPILCAALYSSMLWVRVNIWLPRKWRPFSFWFPFAPAPWGSASNKKPRGRQVDDSKPKTKIQIRFHDGSRKAQEFNEEGGMVWLGKAMEVVGVLFGCLGGKIDGDSWCTCWFNHPPGPSSSLEGHL